MKTTTGEKRICVVNDYDGLYSRFWSKLGVIRSEEEFMEDPKSFDLLCFTGGEDVSPSYYNHANLASGNSPQRDARELKFFRRAVEADVAQTGICRGAQWLSVLSGGTMVQHLRESHGGGEHWCITADGQEMSVTSSHHQMIVPTEEAIILAWADKTLPEAACVYDGRLPLHVRDPENQNRIRVTEAYAYPERKIFGAQFHAEWMRPGCPAWEWQLKMTRKFCFNEEMLPNVQSV